MSLLIVFLLALAADERTAAQMESDNKQFSQLTLEVNQALQRKDMAALDRLLGKDFAYSMFVAGKPAAVMNRSETLGMAERYYTLERFEIRNLAARVLGSVAVVRFQPIREATAGSVDRSGEFAVVDVWVKEGGNWRLTMRYQSRPDPGMTPP